MTRVCLLLLKKFLKLLKRLSPMRNAILHVLVQLGVGQLIESVVFDGNENWIPAESGGALRV